MLAQNRLKPVGLVSGKGEHGDALGLYPLSPEQLTGDCAAEGRGQHG
jgi:hypothetical protein